MNKIYDVVIGIEVHMELKTRTKCFSTAANTFAQTANSMVNPIDAGYPGTLPTLNQAVVISAIKLCSALNMTIDRTLRFDRKNYFYPDLPKGYQITQYYHPIGQNGSLKLKVDDQDFVINFERVHIEEDTAKQIHEDNVTLLDYNRAGIALLELVTQPCFTNAHQVVAYITALRRILIALDISDAKMNEGSLRCDLNISLKAKGTKTLGTKVEIKNLNSLNNITLAVNDEIARQTALLNQGHLVVSQTRRFDEKTNKTVLMREKTTVVDYKYFPEPNIFPIKLDPKWVHQIIASLPELPEAIAQRLVKTYHLLNHEITFLLDKPELQVFFEATVASNKLPKATINYLMGPVQGYLNANEITNINVTKLSANHLGQLIKLIHDQKVNDKQSKLILETIFIKDKNSPKELLSMWDLKVISNEKAIKTLILKIFADNPQMVAEYRINVTKANKFFMGQLMKTTKGQVNPQIAQELVTKLIGEYLKK